MEESEYTKSMMIKTMMFTLHRGAWMSLDHSSEKEFVLIGNINI